MTGTSAETLALMSASIGSIHGKSSFTLIGPPIIASPAIFFSGGNDSPSSSLTVRQATWRAVK